jgi:hypothetical protein
MTLCKNPAGKTCDCTALDHVFTFVRDLPLTSDEFVTATGDDRASNITYFSPEQVSYADNKIKLTSVIDPAHPGKITCGKVELNHDKLFGIGTCFFIQAAMI